MVELRIHITDSENPRKEIRYNVRISALTPEQLQGIREKGNEIYMTQAQFTYIKSRNLEIVGDFKRIIE